MPNENRPAISADPEWDQSYCIIRTSSFFRHSCFGVRHCCNGGCSEICPEHGAVAFVTEAEKRRLADAPGNRADAAVGQQRVHAAGMRAAEIAAQPGGWRARERVAPIVATRVVVAGG